jgi:hypothetical protein
MRLSKLTLLVCAMFFIFLSSGLRAEAAACDEITDNGERLKCKHGRVLGEQERMINNLETHFGQVVGADSIERLKKAHGRANKAKDRMNSKHFKSLAKKNPEMCEIAELSKAWGGNGNENGICEPGELCEEVMGDNIGNDDHICKMKGKNREACVEICGGGGDTMEDEADLASLADLEENYDDVTKSLEAANSALENGGPLMATMAGSVLSAYEPADACKASADWLSFANILTVTIMKQVSVGLRGIADIAERPCDQTAAGFNGAAVCAVVEGAATVMALVTETTEGIFRLVTWGVDNSKQTCMSSLSADLQETKVTLGTVASTTSGSSGQLTGVLTEVQNIKTTVNNLTTKINTLSANLEALQQRTTALSETMNNRFNNVETLLNTPQGRRDSFPQK